MQSEPVAEVSASSNVQPLVDLVRVETEAHTAGVVKIIFAASLPATASPRSRMSFMITFGLASTR
jgi:hypothetical protein